MEDINCWEEKFEMCGYAAKLLDKVTSLNKLVKHPIDIREVKKGIYYARKYHGAQMRQSGELYYSHPIEVAYMVSNYTANRKINFFTTDMIVTSLLHDTIEDTKLTEEMITILFGKKVAEMVNMLSKDDNKNIRTMVNTAFYQNNKGVLLIKLFDRVHNILTLKFKKKEKQLKTALETMHIFLTLALYLNLEDIKELIEKICYDIINNNKNDSYKIASDSYYSSFLNS